MVSAETTVPVERSKAEPPRWLLLLDTETTGIGEEAVCIEVAVALYSVEHAATVTAFSSLVRSENNPAAAVNRISEELVRIAPEPAVAWSRVGRLAKDADAIVAHGADFDRRFVPAGDPALALPWICSMEDLEWPCGEKTAEGMSMRSSLVKLALAHGLGVSHAHRAAVDVDLLARLFSRVGDLAAYGAAPDLTTMLLRGLRPKARFQALVPFERKDEAKVRGFEWEPETKRWLRTMAIEDAGGLPFEVRRVGEVNRGQIERARFAALDIAPDEPPVYRHSFISRTGESPIEQVPPSPFAGQVKPC